MQPGDLVEYGPNLGPQWKKKGMGIVLEVGAFIRVVFPAEKDDRWFHRDNLELISSRKQFKVKKTSTCSSLGKLYTLFSYMLFSFKQNNY